MTNPPQEPTGAHNAINEWDASLSREALIDSLGSKRYEIKQLTQKLEETRAELKEQQQHHARELGIAERLGDQRAKLSAAYAFLYGAAVGSIAALLGFYLLTF